MSEVRPDDHILKQLIECTPEQISAWLDSVAFSMVTDVKSSFGVSPSEPGDPPGVDTGALRASMTWEPDGPFTRYIEDGVEYGVYLELGTEHIAPRPFIAPVFFDWQGKLGDSAASFGLVKA